MEYLIPQSTHMSNEIHSNSIQISSEKEKRSFWSSILFPLGIKDVQKINYHAEFSPSAQVQDKTDLYPYETSAQVIPTYKGPCLSFNVPKLTEIYEHSSYLETFEKVGTEKEYVYIVYIHIFLQLEHLRQIHGTSDIS